MKLFVVGDIHGCSHELVKLLSVVDNKIQKDDRIVFVGDYIDRGPDSKGVIDILISRAASHPNEHIFLKGNHEDMMLSGAHYWALNGGIETLRSYGSSNAFTAYEFNTYMDIIPADHKRFLQNLKSFYKEGRTVVVHAGLNPKLPLEEQEENFMFWDRKYYKYNGAYHDNEYVVIGHTPGHEIQETTNQLAIDTACVFGGKLSCAIIQPEFGTVIDVIQIKSEFNY